MGSKGRKAGYRNRDTARLEARRLHLTEGFVYGTYACTVCGLFHVGSQTPTPVSRYFRQYDDALLAELGERTYHCMRAETEASRNKRLGAIIRRWRSVYRRVGLPVHRSGWIN